MPMLRPPCRRGPGLPIHAARAVPGTADARLLALARAACAGKAQLRRPFLRGRWHASHIGRVAAAVAALGATHGDPNEADDPEAQRAIAERLALLLDTARPVADGLNSLAEFLGGRAASHPDRVILVRPDRPEPPRTEEDEPPSAA